MTPAAVVLVGIAALFTMVSSVISGVVLFRIEARARRERNRDELLTEMRSDMRSLREGMSQGARDAIRGLAGRLDTVEDDADQNRERVIEVRERTAALERTIEGHIRTPAPIAHPAAWGPTVPT